MHAARRGRAPPCCSLKYTLHLVQVGNSHLQAEINTRDNIILVLQGQVMDGAPANTSPTLAGVMRLAATWLADQALEALTHPLLSPEGMAPTPCPIPVPAFINLQRCNLYSWQAQELPSCPGPALTLPLIPACACC